MVPIAFITDVEGNWEFFLACVERSRLLTWTGSELVLADGAYFVFGGDGGDKGYGTLRFYMAVVRLKKKHPDRVFLIIGNRDANKIRFLSEFQDSDINLDVPLPSGVTGNVKSFKEFLREHLVASGVRPNAESVTDADLQANCNATTKMHWVLNSTMGAQGDFEMRRAELKILYKMEQVSDADVIQSYLDSVTPGSRNPCIIEYLQNGDLAVVLDNTLFVHGGIFGTFTRDLGMECCIGHVYGRDKIDDLHKWVATLNLWCQEEIAACLANPSWDAGRSRRNGQGLVDYSAYGACPSVIMAKPLNDLSQPVECRADIAEMLLKHGIYRIVCGHTPHGNCPTETSHSFVTIADGCPVIRNSSIETLLCDTSYSDMQAKDNRGRAVWEVFIHGERTEINGLLPDGQEYRYALAAPGHAFADADPYVGRGPYDQFWVKAKLVTPEGQEPQYLLCKVNRFTYEYKVASLSEVQQIIA